MAKKQMLFRFRAFVSVLTFFTFIGSVISGVILFITPTGRVANRIGWAVWNLDKHEWAALHTDISTVFLIACILHIWLNFKPMVCYFAGKIDGLRRLRLEWIAALIIFVVVCWGSIKPFFPFSSIQQLNANIKVNWSNRQTERQPIPHAEMFSIEKIAERQGSSVETAVENLAGRGLGDSSGRGSGSGFGQKTLSQVCSEFGIDVDIAVEFLGQNGIKTDSKQRIRQIAAENNIRPGEIRRQLNTIP